MVIYIKFRRRKPIENAPFCGREVRSKDDITFLANGTMMSYTQPKAYVFDKNRSHGNDNDNFTSVNLGLVVSV